MATKSSKFPYDLIVLTSGFSLVYFAGAIVPIAANHLVHVGGLLMQNSELGRENGTKIALHLLRFAGLGFASSCWFLVGSALIWSRAR